MEDTININKNENEEFSIGLNPEENESKNFSENITNNLNSEVLEPLIFNNNEEPNDFLTKYENNLGGSKVNVKVIKEGDGLRDLNENLLSLNNNIKEIVEKIQTNQEGGDISTISREQIIENYYSDSSDEETKMEGGAEVENRNLQPENLFDKIDKLEEDIDNQKDNTYQNTYDDDTNEVSNNNNSNENENKPEIDLDDLFGDNIEIADISEEYEEVYEVIDKEKLDFIKEDDILFNDLVNVFRKNPDFLYNNDTDDYIKKPDRIKLDKESNKVELPIYIEKISQYVNDFVLYLKNTVEYNEEIEIP